MSISVKRVKHHSVINDKNSPELWYLRRVAKKIRTYTIESLAREIETTGAMSTDDVIHVMNGFVRRLRIVLTQGDSVKVGSLGTFFTSFNCIGVEEEKNCTVRNIRKVNIRFKVDKNLRLVNDVNAMTRGDNNVEFYIDEDKKKTAEAPEGEGDGNGDGNGNGGGNGGGGEIVDPIV